MAHRNQSIDESFETINLVSPKTIPMLLPENWEEILNKLSPHDFHTAINTCPQWRQLMMPKRTTLLFPLILPILEEYLPLASILQLRGVTKLIKVETEPLLKHYPGIRPPVEKLQHFEKLAPLFRKYNSDSMRDPALYLGEFISHMMTSRPIPSTDPFITGSMSISLAGRNEAETVRRIEMFQTLFSIYGSHLKRIDVKEFVVGGRIMDSIISLLSCFPNIQWINIFGGVYMEEEIVRMNNLPFLFKLEGLHLLTVFEQELSEFDFSMQLITKYGQQLKSLCVNKLLKSRNLGPSLLSSLAPNVIAFEMRSMDPVALETLARVSWQLEELQLGSSSSDARSPDYINGFLDAINHFENSLKKFRFTCSNKRRFSGDWDVGKMIPLRKLETLTFHFTNFELEWVDHFLRISCQRLKQLYLIRNNELTRGHVNSLRDLFQILPKLKKIVVLYGNPQKQRVIYPPVV
ncbi:unnamed protein product [Orchesella dallaii]|uniref:F-box domain-containing protein n=1 Tax=Orchesella dallaii TaxID=48710 RepID=A0ABP1S866_9HEXA